MLVSTPFNTPEVWFSKRLNIARNTKTLKCLENVGEKSKTGI
jgi:hypothetical protein